MVVKNHREARNHQRAVLACTEGVREFPDWWDVWRIMIELCYESGTFTVALGYLRQIRQRNLFAFLAAKELVGRLLRLRRYEDAFAEAKSITKEHPQVSDGYEFLWSCWRGSPERSKLMILQLLKSSAEIPEAYWVATVPYVRACMELKMLTKLWKLARV